VDGFFGFFAGGSGHGKVSPVAAGVSTIRK
jgi:hypothetical protein